MSLNQKDQTGLGIVIILASVLTMAFADALVKLVSSDLTVWQVFVARSLFALPLIAGIAFVRGISLVPGIPRWVFLRSALLVLTWLALYASYPVLKLSVAAVAVYTNPIITALLSAWLLGDRVSARQWFGVLLGFAGVVAILKPGTDDFSWFTLLPLLAAFLYSSAMVITRARCRQEAPFSLAIYLHGLFLLAGLLAVGALHALDISEEAVAAYPFLLNDWTPMKSQSWWLMALLGVLSVAYFVGVARAYQIAPPAIIGTFDYAYLVSAAIWGLVFFGERPGPLTLAGMVLITIAGLLVALAPQPRVESQ